MTTLNWMNLFIGSGTALANGPHLPTGPLLPTGLPLPTGLSLPTRATLPTGPALPNGGSSRGSVSAAQPSGIAAQTASAQAQAPATTPRLRVLCIMDSPNSQPSHSAASAAGGPNTACSPFRLRISGRARDVCAELQRLAA